MQAAPQVLLADAPVCAALIAGQQNTGAFSLSLPFGAFGLKVADFAAATERKVRNNRIAVRKNR